MSTIKLLQGGCLRLMKEIPDGSIDLVLADPPYGKTTCFWDSIIPIEPMWIQLKRVIKKNSAIIMTASQPFTTNLITSNIKMFKYYWVWNKRKAGNFVLSNRMPLKIHEDIVVFYKKSPTYNPQKILALKPNKNYKSFIHKDNSEIAKVASNILRYSSKYEPDKKLPVSIIKFKKVYGKSLIHPTQKPEALMEYLIKTYTNEGETVLDFCMGSGTTGVACKNLNRNFIGIEIDKFYFGVAKLRIEKS